MEGDHRVESIGGAISNHFLAAPWKGFLGGLEDHTDFPWQRLQTRQSQGDPGGDGGVGVVAAGVHDSGNLGAEFEALRLLDRKRIEITAEPHRRVSRADFNGQPGPRGPGAGAQTAVPQLLDDQLGGFVLLMGKFGLPMDGAPEPDHSG